MTSIKYIGWAFVYIGIGVFLIILGMLLIRPFYFAMAMSYSENDTTIKKIGKFTQRKKFTSFLCKEFLTVFRSPGYVFQYFIFALLMPLIVVLYDNLLITFVVNQTGSFMVAGAHVLILCVLANLSVMISASAVSREGGSFYLVKTAPVDFYRQTIAKLAFNAIFTVGAILITAFAGFFYLPAHVVIFSSLAAIFLALGHMFFSFDMDLKKPLLDWYDTGEISSVNKNTAKSIGWGLALGLLAGGIVLMLSADGPAFLPWLVLMVFSISYCLYKAYVLAIRVSYQYDRLEM